MRGFQQRGRRRGGAMSALARNQPRSRAARHRLAAVMLLVAVLLAGLGTALPGRQAEAAPFPVTMRVTIEKVDAIGDLDGACGQADFFATVVVNGVSGTQGPIDGDDNIDPNWQFSATAIHDTGVSVPITINLKDQDGGFCLGDDDIDINAGAGTGLALNVALGNVPCTFSGDASGTCGQPLTVQGDGGGDGSASMIFRIDVLSALPDADGDGLANDWETSGVSFNGQFIDLPAMGADPNKPDIFIQIDWMQNATVDQRLSDAAIQRVVDAFANSPYTSPTGSVGINLHVDQGPGSDLHRGSQPTITWGALSRAQAINPFQMNLGQVDASGNYIWTAFDAIKQSNFVPTGRGPIFHYVTAAFLQEPPPAGGTQNNASGVSRNNDGARFFEGASDFIVSLGGTGGAGTDQQQAGTLMHELGHNLGLGHGGNEGTNYKSNYISIMNYFFQMRGLDVGATGGVLDYSRGVLPPLNEGMLSETNGLGAAGAGRGTAHLCGLSSATPLDRRFIANANGPINWSCETPAVISPGTVSFDASGNGAIDASLTGFDDWANIKFKGGQISALGAVVLPLVSPSEPAIPLDTTPPTTTVTIAPPANAAGWHNASVTVSLTAVDNPGGDGVWDITYSATGAGALPQTTVAGGTANLVVSAEGITTVTFSARDRSGNTSAATQSTIRIDLTDPLISGSANPAANVNGWNNEAVTVTFSCSDALSGVFSCLADGEATASTTLSAEGAGQSASGTAIDVAGNTATATVSPINIDLTKPVVTLTCPTTVYLNASGVTAPWTASDALSGLVTPASGTVALDTSTPGLHTTTTPVAQDAADNTNTASCSYYVIYKFTGFYSPIDNLPTINASNAGQAIPVKWRITDANDVPIDDPASFVNITVVSLSCSAGTTPDAIEEYAAGASGLKNAGGGSWHFNWETPKSYANSCKTMKLNLNDTVGMTDAQLASIGRTAAFRFK